MFCTNCGKEVHPKAVACPGCGVPPRLERKFCHNCGVAVQPNQAVCTKCGVALGAAAATGEKNKVAAGLLGIFFGQLGAHKFYLGYTKEAVIMLLISLIGTLFVHTGTWAIVWLIAFVESIIYLTKSDSEFASSYVRARRPWF